MSWRSEQELDGDDSMPQILLAQDEGGESWDAFNLWFLGRKRNDFGEGQGAVMGPEQWKRRLSRLRKTSKQADINVL